MNGGQAPADRNGQEGWRGESERNRGVLTAALTVRSKPEALPLAVPRLSVFPMCRHRARHSRNAGDSRGESAEWAKCWMDWEVDSTSSRNRPINTMTCGLDCGSGERLRVRRKG